MDAVMNGKDRIYGAFSNLAPVGCDDQYYLRARFFQTGRTLPYDFPYTGNGSLGPLESPIIRLKIGRRQYPVYTIADFERFRQRVENDSEHNPFTYLSNESGLIAERRAYYEALDWLVNFEGRSGEVVNRDDLTDHLDLPGGEIMLIRNPMHSHPHLYPPISGDCRKELDGFFIYERGDDRYIIVLESKIAGLSVRKEHLYNNLFRPLQELYPGSRFIYLVQTSLDSIRSGGFSDERKMVNYMLKDEPTELYLSLKAKEVGTLFLGQSESKGLIYDMTSHILDLYQCIENGHAPIRGKLKHGLLILHRAKSLDPFLILQKQPEGGWKELPIRGKTG